MAGRVSSEDVGDVISDSISDLASIGSRFVFDIFGAFGSQSFSKSALRSRERSRAFPLPDSDLLLRGPL